MGSIRGRRQATAFLVKREAISFDVKNIYRLLWKWLLNFIQVHCDANQLKGGKIALFILTTFPKIESNYT